MRFTVTLTHKYIFSIFAALLLLGCVLFGVSIHFMGNALYASIEQSVMRLQRMVDTYNTRTGYSFVRLASMGAENGVVVEALQKGDVPAVQAFARHLQQVSVSDFCTITDARGTVMGRGHSDRHGDDVSSQETVMRALRDGTANVDIVQGTVVPFTLRASAPVYSPDGKIVGSISIGRALSEPAYVDDLKKLTGLDATIFKNDTRVQTTLLQADGSRAIGTRVSDPAVLDAVFKRGENFFTITELFGFKYASCYWPMRDNKGETVGIWFIGAPVTEIFKLRDDAVRNTLVATCLVLLFQLVLSLIIGIRIGRPVKQITHYAGVVAADPMSKEELPVCGKDDMGLLADSLRSMIDRLQKNITLAEHKTAEADAKTQEARQAMEDAREARDRAERAQREGMLAAAAQIEGVVDNINSALANLTEQVQTSNAGAEQSASRLSETATAMEQMNATVLEVANNADTASTASSQTRDKANSGEEVVQKAVTAIQTVHDQTRQLKDDMNILGEQAQAINRIMAVISDIADQTNLLALNAAIEAARAGEAGRGFAVVADEVRKLAEKTMASTADVGNAIRAIQDSTNKSREQVDKSVDIISEATELANQSGQALQEIVQMVDGSADQVRAIATASEEQSAASEQINRSIMEVNQLSARTSEAMHTAMTALEQLQQQADTLTRLLTDMKNA